MKDTPKTDWIRTNTGWAQREHSYMVLAGQLEREISKCKDPALLANLLREFSEDLYEAQVGKWLGVDEYEDIAKQIIDRLEKEK